MGSEIEYNGRILNEIDYILSKTKEVIEEVTVMYGFWAGSDQQALRESLKINELIRRLKWD